MMIYRVPILILVIACIVCCVGCGKREISAEGMVGKWVWEIDIPEEQTGLKDVKEATIELFEDKTFKMRNVPAAILSDLHRKQDPSLRREGGKGAVFNGSGTWKIHKLSGSHMLALRFLEINGGEDPKFGWDVQIDRIPGFGTSLYYEYDEPYFMSFHKSNAAVRSASEK